MTKNITSIEEYKREMIKDNIRDFFMNILIFIIFTIIFFLPGLILSTIMSALTSFTLFTNIWRMTIVYSMFIYILRFCINDVHKWMFHYDLVEIIFSIIGNIFALGLAIYKLSSITIINGILSNYDLPLIAEFYALYITIMVCSICISVYYLIRIYKIMKKCNDTRKRLSQ